MATFTPKMLRDLLESQDPKDQELARQLSDLEFSNETGRLANYPAPRPYGMENEAARLGNYPPPAAQVPDQSALNNKYIRGSIGDNGSGGMAVQDMPFSVTSPPRPRPAVQRPTTQPPDMGSGDSFVPMTGGSQPVPLGLNAFEQAAWRRANYGPGDTSKVQSGTGQWSSGSGTGGRVGELATQTTTPSLPNSSPPIRKEGYAANEKILDQMQQRDGKIIQLVEAPSIDGFGRQTMARWTRVVMPDELDPYKQAKAKADKLAAETRALSPQGIQDAARAKKAGEDAANQERRARLTPAQRAAEDYKATGGKLAVDQEVDPVTGVVRAKPGSKLYQTQKNAHATDFTAAANVADSVDAAKVKIDRILADKEGFASNFGGYNAKLATQYFPDAQNTKKNIESLKADMKKAGLEVMRSGGSIGMMTEREWPIVEAQIAAIDPLLGEDEARIQLQAVADRLEVIKQRAAEKYKTEWSEHPFYKEGKTSQPASGPKMGTVKNGYVFRGGDPANPKSWMRL